MFFKLAAKCKTYILSVLSIPEPTHVDTFLFSDEANRLGNQSVLPLWTTWVESSLPFCAWVIDSYCSDEHRPTVLLPCGLGP